jgi:hypothetical protein
MDDEGFDRSCIDVQGAHRETESGIHDVSHVLLPAHRNAGFSGLNIPAGLSFQIQAWTNH